MEEQRDPTKEELEKVQEAMAPKIPEFYAYMQQTIIQQIKGNYAQAMKALMKLKGDTTAQFPLDEFGLTCYIQGQTDLFEAMADQDEDENALDFLKRARTAWLEAKFKAPSGSVPPSSPGDASQDGGGIVLP